MASELPNGLKLDHIRGYLENRTKEFGTLRGEVSAKNGSALREIAHKIKGNAALYGMADLGLSAGRLVEALDLSDWQLISARVDELIGGLERERLRFKEAFPPLK